MLYPPLSGQTEQTSTWDGPQMVQQSASAGQPIGDAEHGHMTREKDSGPMGACQAENAENVKYSSHLYMTVRNPLNCQWFSAGIISNNYHEPWCRRHWGSFWSWKYVWMFSQICLSARTSHAMVGDGQGGTGTIVVILTALPTTWITV